MPGSDIVADLYDGFLSADDPAVCEQVTRTALRYEERQPHRIASRRVLRWLHSDASCVPRGSAMRSWPLRCGD